MTSLEAQILVLTHDDDPTADVVLHELNARGVPFVRCDPGDFPTTLSLTATIDTAAGAWSGRLRNARRDMSLESVRSVYYRRPSDFRFSGGLSDAEQQFAASQARHGLFGTLAGLPGVAWLNHPAAMADARVKTKQLAIAVSCGFDIPATSVTNDPAEVSDFARGVGGRIITKSLATMVTIDEDKGNGVIYTAEVPEGLWTDASIAGTAHLFQEFLPGIDVRLTVVGDQLFAAEIHPHDQDGPIDIRAHHQDVNYRPVDVPDAIRNATFAILGKLGLTFAAVDFRIVPNRGWVFLEVNPNGQWAFIPELRTPIAHAIADILEKSNQ